MLAAFHKQGLPPWQTQLICVWALAKPHLHGQDSIQTKPKGENHRGQ